MYQLRRFGLSATGERRKGFFRDPSKWWDDRSSKRSPRQPDFRHKVTCRDSCDNPSWVREELLRSGLGAEQQDTGRVNNPSTAADALSPSLIWACSKNKDLQRGTRIHDELQKRGLVDKNCSDALVTMYAKCGELQKAQALLDMHNSSYFIPWTALIAGYAREGKGQKALDCFEQMQRKGILPNEVTYACILKACAAIGDIDKGKKVHDEISRQGLLEHDIVLGGALVHMYAKCGALLQAQSVLEKLPSRNVMCWNALIAGYAQNGQGQQALDCFEQMQCEGILPDQVTYVCILKACAVIGAVDKGKKVPHPSTAADALSPSLIWACSKNKILQRGTRIHNGLQKRGLGDKNDSNALVTMFANCGELQKAQALLDKVKKVHDEISRQGLLEHHIVLGGALVDMYAKCGAFLQAQSVLEKLPSRNVVCWNALISGYAQNGQGQQALDCFEQMQREGIHPNEVTYVCILKACAAIGAIDKGKKFHDEISGQGLLEHHIVLGTALVDMYAKCGALRQAQSVLEKLPSRDVVSWNALIAGYAQNGQGQQGLNCLEQMQCEGILPNEVTFCCLLNLCSHLGMVDKGQKLFDSMEAMYGLKPNVETLTCMADLLGRAGHLAKAVEVIQGMPFSADSAIWLCLLGACRKWVDVNVGTWAFEQAVELDKCNGAAYVLMVNIYAATGIPEKAKDIPRV